MAAGRAERATAGISYSPLSNEGSKFRMQTVWALIFDFFLVSGAALCSAIRLTHVQHPQLFKGVRRDTPRGFFFPFSFWVEDIKEVSVVWQFC